MSSSSDKYSNKLCEQRKANGDPCQSLALREKKVLPLPRANGSSASRHQQQRNHPFLSCLSPSTRRCHLNPIRDLRSLRDDAPPPHRAQRSYSPVLRHAGRVHKFGLPERHRKSKTNFGDEFTYLLRSQTLAARNNSGLRAAAPSQTTSARLIKSEREKIEGAKDRSIER